MGFRGVKLSHFSGRFLYILARRGPVVHIGVTANILVNAHSRSETAPHRSPKIVSRRAPNQLAI